MIEFSQIDKDLSVYKNRKVFLWGAGDRGGKAKRILDAFGIKIEAFVDSNSEKCKKNKLGISIISFDELCQRVGEDDSCLVQISCEDEKNIIYKLKGIGVPFVTFAEFRCRTDSLSRYILSKDKNFADVVCKRIKYRSYGTNAGIIEYFSWNILSEYKSYNLIASAPKCGNTSLRSNFPGYHLFTEHTFDCIDKEVMNYLKTREVNIICGVRDIISQELSCCFELMDLCTYWDMEEFWKGGGDVEAIFNQCYLSHVDGDTEFSRYMEYTGYDYTVPDFFEKQIKKHWDIDVYNYSFDKDAGYTIINKDNVHVMIYQLEKMDKLEKQISNFLGCGDNITFQKENDASKKWYNDSYKKAKKEIKFDREYFTECYEGKYMKHFYNDEDIERFKQKWIGNVRN